MTPDPDRVMEPFRGIFTPIELGATQGNEVASIFETSVLFAMIVYAIVAMVISALANWLGRKLHCHTTEASGTAQLLIAERLRRRSLDDPRSPGRG